MERALNIAYMLEQVLITRNRTLKNKEKQHINNWYFISKLQFNESVEEYITIKTNMYRTNYQNITLYTAHFYHSTLNLNRSGTRLYPNMSLNISNSPVVIHPWKNITAITDSEMLKGIFTDLLSFQPRVTVTLCFVKNC